MWGQMDVGTEGHVGTDGCGDTGIKGRVGRGRRDPQTRGHMDRYVNMGVWGQMDTGTDGQMDGGPKGLTDTETHRHRGVGTYGHRATDTRT